MVFFFQYSTVLACHGLLVIEVSQTHSLTHTTVGRTPLDEWSARRRNLYLTTHNTHTQTSTPPAVFEPTIPASERPQTYGFRPRGHWDRLATWSSTATKRKHRKEAWKNNNIEEQNPTRKTALWPWNTPNVNKMASNARRNAGEQNKWIYNSQQGSGHKYHEL